VTASCSPPACNIGFPVVPASLSTDALVTSCTQFFHALYPKFIDCRQLIPAPVYADTAISGVITGATATASLLATSTGCAPEPPATCSASVYSISTARAATGPENPLPAAPNSLLFDLTGDKAFMGSDFGAQIISPANLGSSNSPFTSLGTVTGNVLATSNNGTFAAFSDRIHTPNQVYVVNAANVTSLSATALNIPGAVAAAFSPDGLKTFIIGGSAVGGNTGTSLYVYSTQQALKGPVALAAPASSVAFSPNGAFAFVAEAAPNGGSANLTAFNTCDNQFAASFNLGPATLPAANQVFMKVLPNVHIDGRDPYGYAIPDGIHVFVLDATGFDIITSAISPPAAGTLCPQTLTFLPSGDPLHAVQRIELGQGTLQPVNFFASADGSQLYIASAGHASILVYDFGTGAVTGIELLGNATPVSADMSVDDGTIVVAGSDGMLHQVTTDLGGNDLVQLSFPSLPNYLNPFCTFTPSQGPCTLNMVVVKP
jgi:hypothetical protein